MLPPTTEPGVVVTPLLHKIAKSAAVPRSIRSNGLLEHEALGEALGVAFVELDSVVQSSKTATPVSVRFLGFRTEKNFDGSCVFT